MKYFQLPTSRKSDAVELSKIIQIQIKQCKTHTDRSEQIQKLIDIERKVNNIRTGSMHYNYNEHLHNSAE